MTRRLLKAVGSRGLYETTDPEFGTWTSWEPLPPPADVDPARQILANQGGPLEVRLSLYGNPDANHDTERRRKVDALLEARGLRPPRTW